ncbi:helicase associated domain-containing protein [Aeromicrobium sp. Leaf245]|uniref:helicase associated domain-containing protein n=1 Tax=Aeromicrobium sp. Leaf245 TaxID=1736306 RepID=UPI0006FD63FB|nr:helicase associated domain-containing protein [Aeromicrobium sp. Leaf245]KQO38893.1 hypothetical protein ASF05_03160 [Aeromicrobium sp. Leaf245]
MSEQQSWHGASWEVGHQHLAQWVEANGSAEVPVDHVCEDSFRLGRWVNTQRLARRAGRLSAERTALLDDLGLVWDPAARKQRLIFEAFSTYVEAHGHGDVPSSYKTETGVALGSWVRRQRSLLTDGACAPDVEELFHNLGVNIQGLRGRERGAMLQALERFSGHHGHSRVPANFTSSDGLELGRWIAAQRSNVRAERASREVIEAFERLGVDIEVVAGDEVWDEHYEELLSYRRQHGNVEVEASFVSRKGVRLGQWIGVQRSRYHRGSLRPDRSKRLEDVGFDWGMQRGPSRTWFEADIIAALQEAATLVFPLRPAAYQELVTSGALTGPNRSSVISRFGTWEAACAAAGVEA